MHADRSDLLVEAIPELLKNMLLVMQTAGILSLCDEQTVIWRLTWHRIDAFLPHLREDLFKPHTPGNEIITFKQNIVSVLVFSNAK